MFNYEIHRHKGQKLHCCLSLRLRSEMTHLILGLFPYNFDWLTNLHQEYRFHFLCLKLRFSAQGFQLLKVPFLVLLKALSAFQFWEATQTPLQYLLFQLVSALSFHLKSSDFSWMTHLQKFYCLSMNIWFEIPNIQFSVPAGEWCPLIRSKSSIELRFHL